MGYGSAFKNKNWDSDPHSKIKSGIRIRIKSLLLIVNLINFTHIIMESIATLLSRGEMRGMTGRFSYQLTLSQNFPETVFTDKVNFVKFLLEAAKCQLSPLTSVLYKSHMKLNHSLSIQGIVWLWILSHARADSYFFGLSWKTGCKAKSMYF